MPPAVPSEGRQALYSNGHDNTPKAGCVSVGYAIQESLADFREIPDL